VKYYQEEMDMRQVKNYNGRRSTSYKVFVLMLLSVILLPVFSLSINAQEQKSKKEITLTLREAIDLALRNNLDIKLDYFSVKQTEGAYISSKALNDINFYNNNSWSSTTRISTGLFSGGTDEIELIPGVGVTTTDTDAWVMTTGLTEKIPTGGTWTIEMQMQTSDSTNRFSYVKPSRDASLQLSFQQPILKGFGFSFDIPQKDIIISRNNLDISMESFKTNVMNNLYNVINAYWNLVYRQKDLEVKRQALQLAEDQLRRNKTQVEVGTMAPIEIVSAEAGVAQAEQAIIAAEAALKEGQDNLIKMLYIPKNIDDWNFDLQAVDEPSADKIETDLAKQIETAYENRPDIKGVKIDMESKELQVDAASWGLLPNVSLTGSVTYNGSGGDFLIYDDDNVFNLDRHVIGYTSVIFSDVFDQIYNKRFADWSIGLNVSFPLFNSQARGELANQKAARTLAKVNLIKKRQEIIADVRKAVRDVETNYLQIKASEKARILAERQLEAEQKKFDVGSSTNFQVLTYQKELVSAKTAEVQARINYSLSLYNLQLQTGTLLILNDITINPLEEDNINF
jgi:outer membrane protein TolC/type II secretory pathway pseudopilin PulG